MKYTTVTESQLSELMMDGWTGEREFSFAIQKKEALQRQQWVKELEKGYVTYGPGTPTASIASVARNSYCLLKQDHGRIFGAHWPYQIPEHRISHLQKGKKNQVHGMFPLVQSNYNEQVYISICHGCRLESCPYPLDLILLQMVNPLILFYLTGPLGPINSISPTLKVPKSCVVEDLDL